MLKILVVFVIVFNAALAVDYSHLCKTSSSYLGQNGFHEANCDSIMDGLTGEAVVPCLTTHEEDGCDLLQPGALKGILTFRTRTTARERAIPYGGPFMIRQVNAAVQATRETPASSATFLMFAMKKLAGVPITIYRIPTSITKSASTR